VSNESSLHLAEKRSAGSLDFVRLRGGCSAFYGAEGESNGVVLTAVRKRGGCSALYGAEGESNGVVLTADLWRAPDQAVQDLWRGPDEYRAFRGPALRDHHVPQCGPVPQLPAAVGDDAVAAGVSLELRGSSGRRYAQQQLLHRKPLYLPTGRRSRMWAHFEWPNMRWGRRRHQLQVELHVILIPSVIFHCSCECKFTRNTVSRRA
jgi:hypothetical protein